MVTNDWRNLEFASPELQADREVVLAAVKQSGGALHFTPPSIRADREIMQIAVEQSPHAMFYASAVGLHNERGVVLAAVSKDGSTLQYASAALCADKEIVTAALEQSHNLKHAQSHNLTTILKHVDRGLLQRDYDVWHAAALACHVNMVKHDPPCRLAPATTPGERGGDGKKTAAAPAAAAPAWNGGPGTCFVGGYNPEALERMKAYKVVLDHAAVHLKSVDASVMRQCAIVTVAVFADFLFVPVKPKELKSIYNATFKNTGAPCVDLINRAARTDGVVRSLCATIGVGSTVDPIHNRHFLGVSSWRREHADFASIAALTAMVARGSFRGSAGAGACVAVRGGGGGDGGGGGGSCARTAPSCSAPSQRATVATAEGPEHALRLLVRGRTCWSLPLHQFLPRSVRRRVTTVMLVGARIDHLFYGYGPPSDSGDGGGGGGDGGVAIVSEVDGGALVAPAQLMLLPALPPELWLHILHFVPRRALLPCITKDMTTASLHAYQEL